MARRKFGITARQSKSVKNPEYLSLDVYRGSYTLTELQNIRRTLAKRANQRIVRLERGKSSITGESWNEFGAVIDVYSYLESSYGKKRFKESAKSLTDKAKLRREITVLQAFIGSKTSTVAGMREIERKRVQSFESGKWGTAFKTSGRRERRLKFASTKEFYNFLNSETFIGIVSSGFTSEQIIDIYDSARSNTANNDDVLSAMEDALKAYREKGNASLKDLQRRMNAIQIQEDEEK